MRGLVRMVAALAATVVLAALAGCGGAQYADGKSYRIAGGGPAGVYYAYGERFAEELHRGLGLDISVSETRGSVDNLLRVGSGDALLGFAQGDTAADAIAGVGAFDEPLPVRAVARVYDEYVHIVVPADSEIRGIAELRGRRVSLGALNSGVAVIAERVLDSSGVPVDAVDNPALGLDDSIRAMEAGEIDAFFWVGGLPTPGIERLSEAMPVRMLSIGADTVEAVNAGHAGVYRIADFPIGAYGIETSSETMTVPNYLVTSESAPHDLVYDVAGVLFASRASIARSVPAAAFLDRRQAIFTEPMALHPGAADYYVDTRR